MVLLASNYDRGRFFKAADLTNEKKVKIKSATEELIGADKEKKLVIWFTNDDRGLVLNKTTNRVLRGAFGDACDGWTGKVIVLFPTTDDFRGKMVPVIRARIPAPKGNGQPAKAKSEPDELEQLIPSNSDEFDDEVEL